MNFVSFVRTNWLFLLAGFILTLTSSYGQTFFISLFAGGIMDDFGLTDGQWGGLYTLGTTASAITMIWAGTLVDRFRVRVIGTLVFAGLAAACFFMAAVPNAALLVLAIFFLRLFGQGMSSHLATVSMARWFVAGRGKALAVASMGYSVGQAVLPIVFVALLITTDWRTLWVVAGVIVVVTIPLMGLLLRQERTPQSLAKDEQAAGMHGRHWTRADVLRHPLFWLMVPALLGPPAWGTALWFQQVHLTEVKGWTLAGFVALFPLFTVISIASNFATGWAIDRFGSGRIVPFYMLPFALAFGIIALAPSIPIAALGMAVLGIGQGLQSTLPGAFWAEFYGTRHIGAIKAAAAAIMVFGSAIGPGVSGYLIDWGVDFPAQMIGYLVFFLIAAAMATLGVTRARASLATT
ncbi:MFS transporter [Loktanella sp. TSTF-M6]|uniref:MFS transporter n=1 Tax=Loktanella gaetbuli TaxID=2881335 RepID=A0ABS8BTZ0_9RHOB|nr:MFS transporter [Loktanella gaetbuli]MCB5199200.1 MFS transporter [Loktanella gaetbuli]